MNAPHGPLRARGGHAHARVTHVELFFDLVFVFAITQLSHGLLQHFTPLGALQTAVLFLAVWWAWINTAWATNWIEPDRGPARAMLFGLMLAGLGVAMAIPHAFDTMGLVFALCYVAAELTRGLFMLAAIGDRDPGLLRNFQRVLAWQVAAAPFWIIGGLLDGTPRLLAWMAALAVWTAAPLVGFRMPGLGRSTTADWTVDGAHMAERCALFVIIALGESVLVAGATFAALPWTRPNLLAFLVAFAGTVAMWWIYFHIGAGRATRLIAGADDPGRYARLAYTYLHIPIVAGIVAAAVADDRLLHNADGGTGWGDALVILVGPALYLAGVAAFKRLSLGWLPLSHSVALGLLAALLPVATSLSPLALAAATVAILVTAAAWEHLSLRRTEAA